MKTRLESKKRHARIMLWSAVIIVFGAMFLPLASYVYVDVVSAKAAAAQEANPRANYWRAIREGNEGYTAASGPYTTNVLIQNGGQNWRQFRNGPVANYTPWVLAVVVLMIGLYHIIKGTQRIEGFLSGQTVPRWSRGERILHWYTASLFIVLAITGLSLLFGRAVLIPIMGPWGFGAWAGFAITLHNYLGPFFVVGVLLEILFWARINIPKDADWQWFKKVGGLFSGEHVPAGRSNGGEKVWFWIVAVFGITVSVTGLILDFPNFEQSRETMQLMNIIHGIAGVIWAAIALGHIYMGTLGNEGALQGMTQGRVSVEWAKQHHDLWYQEVKDQASAGTETAAEPSSAAKQPG
jgi:formate dehydrogenase subunit gamma